MSLKEKRAMMTHKRRLFKDTSIGLSLKKIRYDKGRQGYCDSISHAEEERIEVGERILWARPTTPVLHRSV
jgi:hypothetical protein